METDSLQIDTIVKTLELVLPEYAYRIIAALHQHAGDTDGGLASLCKEGFSACQGLVATVIVLSTRRDDLHSQLLGYLRPCTYISGIQFPPDQEIQQSILWDYWPLESKQYISTILAQSLAKIALTSSIPEARSIATFYLRSLAHYIAQPLEVGIPGASIHLIDPRPGDHETLSLFETLIISYTTETDPHTKCQILDSITRFLIDERITAQFNIFKQEDQLVYCILDYLRKDECAEHLPLFLTQMAVIVNEGARCGFNPRNKQLANCLLKHPDISRLINSRLSSNSPLLDPYKQILFRTYEIPEDIIQPEHLSAVLARIRPQVEAEVENII